MSCSFGSGSGSGAGSERRVEIDIEDIAVNVAIQKNPGREEQIRDFIIDRVTNHGASYYEDLIKPLRALQRDIKNNDRLNKGGGMITKNEIRSIIVKYKIPMTNKTMMKSLVKKEMRSMSGVIVVTVFTSPRPEYTDPVTGEKKVQSFSCKHDCYYCPNEPAHEGNNFTAQPRSYLYKEPGVLRANDCGFDCVKQFHTRVQSYIQMGHPIDKLEVLVLGGTWSEYPPDYQEEFLRDIYYAANTIQYSSPASDSAPPSDPPETSDSGTGTKFKSITTDWTKARGRGSLQEELDINSNASMTGNAGIAKVIGITIETRPDSINPAELMRLRDFGVTRVQIGAQHTNDNILKKINRGHTVTDTVRAIRCLKRYGFKVDIHIMPMLPGATPKEDIAMFKEFLHNPDLQADQWKIYPTSVTPWTVIEKWYKSGKYVPYSWEELVDIIVPIKTLVPTWVRLNRVVRDINSEYIMGGCDVPHGRQLIQKRMQELNVKCRCIRCREVKDMAAEGVVPQLVIQTYKCGDATEYFLSFEDVVNDRLYGFLRLRIPSAYDILALKEELPKKSVIPYCALIREVHVYSKVKTVGANNGEQTTVQHTGLGTALVAEAEKIAIENGFGHMAVISGVGARGFYAKNGYHICETYMVKSISYWNRVVNYIWSFLGALS